MDQLGKSDYKEITFCKNKGEGKSIYIYIFYHIYDE